MSLILQFSSVLAFVSYLFPTGLQPEMSQALFMSNCKILHLQHLQFHQYLRIFTCSAQPSVLHLEWSKLSSGFSEQMSPNRFHMVVFNPAPSWRYKLHLYISITICYSYVLTHNHYWLTFKLVPDTSSFSSLGRHVRYLRALSEIGLSV